MTRTARALGGLGFALLALTGGAIWWLRTDRVAMPPAASRSRKESRPVSSVVPVAMAEPSERARVIEDPATVDPALPDYEPVAGISGDLSSVGSDTLINLMTMWADEFRQLHPKVHVQIESKGSSTAPAAPLAGTAQLGPMSREMKPSELEDFEQRFGYPPTPIRVAIDVLAVYVNKENPIEQLTMAQLDAIFGKQRKAGFPKDVATWGDLGLGGEWATLPIRLFGRNSASSAYGFIRERVLKNGDFKDTVAEQPGSASVVLSVGEDEGGIGYSSAAYRISSVRTVPIAPDENREPGIVGATSVYDGTYPLTRFLYVYVNKAPQQLLDPLVKAFLTYALSQQGQQAVLKDGRFPLPATVARDEFRRIQ